MAKARKSALLLPLHKQILYVVSAVLWLTGTIWLLVQSSLLMKLHGAAAMVFLMAFGALWLEHVPEGWTQKEHRPSGVTLTATCAVLIFTGWGLYYLAGDTVRSGMHWVHTIMGLLLPVIIFLHVRLNPSNLDRMQKKTKPIVKEVSHEE